MSAIYILPTRHKGENYECKSYAYLHRQHGDEQKGCDKRRKAGLREVEHHTQIAFSELKTAL